MSHHNFCWKYQPHTATPSSACVATVAIADDEAAVVDVDAEADECRNGHARSRWQPASFRCRLKQCCAREKRERNEENMTKKSKQAKQEYVRWRSEFWISSMWSRIGRQDTKHV